MQAFDIKEKVVKKWVAVNSFMLVALAGCGSEDSVYQPKAGDKIFTTVAVDGREVQKETYKYYALTDSRRLVDDPSLVAAGAPQIAILESRENKQLPLVMQSAHMVSIRGAVDEVDHAAVIGFVEELIYELGNHYPSHSIHELAWEFADLDESPEGLYKEYMASGLPDVKSYVAFYETVDAHYSNSIKSYSDMESDLRDFMMMNDLTIAYFGSVLERLGEGFSSLYAELQRRGMSVFDLDEQYRQSGMRFPDFLAKFFGKTSAMQGEFAYISSDVGSKGGAAEVGVEAAKLGLKVAKFAWEIIKDGRPKTTAEGAYTTILSVKDGSYENYEYAVRGESPVVSYTGKNLFGMTLYDAQFKLDGAYKATHPSVPGYWMPSVAFKVENAFAGFTWNLNAGAAITSAVNRASASAPEPEIQVVANVQANGWFQSFTKSFDFYANARTGFRNN
ncbi:MAG: hypothetical protein PHI49_06015 [Halothiobacillaceae bacterium]|nr:hypothetical protein [Halothiobacillaceae bacterium]